MNRSRDWGEASEASRHTTMDLCTPHESTDAGYVAPESGVSSYSLCPWCLTDKEASLLAGSRGGVLCSHKLASLNFVPWVSCSPLSEVLELSRGQRDGDLISSRVSSLAAP